MINRRTFVKLSAGSMVATIAMPTFAHNQVESAPIKTLVVYHKDSTAGPSFFAEVLNRGAGTFTVTGDLEPARKQEFLRQLSDQPAMVVGLTNRQTAFELQMAAADAFHFKVPEERFKIDHGGNGLLVAWAVAPVTEVLEGR